MGAAVSGHRSSTVATVLGVFLMVMLFRNIASKDYKTETKSYLKSIGKEDAIDKVIPRTAQDFRNEKLRTAQTIEDLVTNVTALQRDVQYLRSENVRLNDMLQETKASA